MAFIARCSSDLPDDACAYLDSVDLIRAADIRRVGQEPAARIVRRVVLIARQVYHTLLLRAVRPHQPQVEVRGESGIVGEHGVYEAVAVGVLAIAGKGDAVLADNARAIRLELIADYSIGSDVVVGIRPGSLRR